MNKFCVNCPNRKIPKILKEKFNQLNFSLFLLCPINDRKIYGCTSKYHRIKWEMFFKFLCERGVLTEKERKLLEKAGWKIA